MTRGTIRERYYALRLDLLDPLAWALSRREVHGLLPLTDPREIVEAARHYRGYGHYGSIKPLQSQSEITALLQRVVATRPRAVLELGTSRGGTLWMWCRGTMASRFVSVDLPGGPYGGGYDHHREKLYREFLSDRPKATMGLLRADSHADETLEAVKVALADTPLDFLFIDADHCYEGVKRDFQLYAPLVEAGGVIALHDVLRREGSPDYGVDRFWSELKSRFSCEEIVADPNQGMMGIGVLIKE